MEEPQVGLPQEPSIPQPEEPKQAEDVRRAEESKQADVLREVMEPQEEKKEFLRREEIKTMSKDISQLREIEAQKEKERLIALKARAAEEKIAVPVAPATQPPKVAPVMKPPQKEELPPSLISLPQKKFSFSKKFLIRLAIVLIILLFIGLFFYWLLVARNQPSPEIMEEFPAAPTSTAPATPGNVVPSSLIEMQSTVALEATSSENIPLLVSEFLGTQATTSGFARILIKNTGENKYLGLNDFFSVFNINCPAGLTDKLSDDFTLFVYSNNGLNRLGFLTEIKDKENIYAAGKSWEPTMEKDTETFFSYLGNGKTSHPSSFKQAFYKKIPFRYVSFSTNKFGICWSTYNYFIWTTSGESMLRIIDILTQK